MAVTEKGITLKLFAGFPVNSEFRMHVRNSSNWKEYEILQKNESKALRYVHFNDKDYLGIYIEPAILSLEQIDIIEFKIRNFLVELFPKYSSESLMLSFFSQAFIH